MKGIFQLLFLSILFPTLLILCGEGIARGVLSLLPESPESSHSIALHMPAWMMFDENSRQKGVEIFSKQQDIDWLHIFEKGNGFRVRLIPERNQQITNSFSMIRSEKKRLYQVRANRLGFRGENLQKKKPQGTYRILIFGDSSSFGWGVDEDKIFSALLKNKLSKQVEKTIEIGNFAMPGDSSEYGRLIYEKFAHQYDPDLVILGFGANDAKYVLRPHQEQVTQFRNMKTLHKVRGYLNRTAIYQLSERFFSKIQKTKELPLQSTTQKKYEKKLPAVSKTRFAKNLKKMSSGQKGKKQYRTLILSLCTPGHYAKVAKRVAKSRRALYFNGQRYLKKKIPEIQSGSIYPEMVAEMKSRYPISLSRNKKFHITSDGCHPNALGNQIIADKITEMLIQKNVI